MLQAKEILVFQDDYYVIVRSFNNFENFPIKEAKDFYHCDKALKVNDMIYFCRKMEVVDIIEEKNNEDGQIQLVEEIQEETAA
jgi:hypothetical protein